MCGVLYMYWFNALCYSSHRGYQAKDNFNEGLPLWSSAAVGLSMEKVTQRETTIQLNPEMKQSASFLRKHPVSPLVQNIVTAKQMDWVFFFGELFLRLQTNH